MSAELIDGRTISAAIKSEVEADVKKLISEKSITPGLAVVLVGDDPASRTYVSMKAKTCAKIGMNSWVETYPAEMSETDVLQVINRLNTDRKVHGILVQLPLPKHIDSHHIINAIDPRKDVDGLHPYNSGLLASGQPSVIPCTPFGICELLLRSNVKISGREAVVLGRSNLVGRPISTLLSSKAPYGDATVTVCHSRSDHLKEICRRADILVVAIGRRKFVSADMVKPGAVVIDVGSHPPRDESEKMCGDVDFDSVKEIASKITPVPGGVGPMTIAMLMRNTVDAAIAQSV
ncbi:MAG: bifunctional methylenetetrahydrofolate dehydrogenase/methenyltetrahydrofolate cyclohydrolase FolD [Calditrichota bacterium]